MQDEPAIHDGPAPQDGPDLADDLLVGVKGIRTFMGPEKFTERAIYHLIEKGAIPVTRLPGVSTIYGSKAKLRSIFSKAA